MTNDKSNTLLIYTPQISNRLKYILDLILKQELGLEYEISVDKNYFENSDFNKFSYSKDNYFSNFPFLESHCLLQDTEILTIDIDIFSCQNNKAFFKTGSSSFFTFDIFAASFYLISRYEEYLPYTEDKHGRFQAEHSLAYKEDFLELPLVNIWINLFKIKLLNQFPSLIFIPQKFRFISTIDIDNAYADIHKGIFRTSFSIIKLLALFRLKELIEKIKVLRLRLQDKYDNYDYLKQVHEEFGFKPIYFILFSKYGKYDKNLSTNNIAFKNLIKKLSKDNQIGLHPSYQSNKSFEIIEKEKKNLEEVISNKITYSRQHFLKFKLPDTFVNLNKLGIKQDFSMGYSSKPGFRASISSHYNFFNLITNEETKLQIIPFAVMDACFIHYLELNHEQTSKKIKKIIESVKKVNGLFVSLWHNETFYQTDCGWRQVFEQMLYEIKNENSI